MKGVLLWPFVALVAVFALYLSPLTAQAADYDPAKDQVYVVVANNTYPESAGAPWDGILVETWVDIDSSSTMMSCIVAALDEYGYEQEGAESNYISSIAGLAQMDGSDMAGWMMLCNDWFINTGAGDVTVANGGIGPNDEIEVYYTCEGYGEDIGSFWSNNDKTLAALNFSDGELSPAFSSDAHTYTLTLPASVNKVRVVPTASNKNFQVKAYLGDQATGTEYKRTQFIPVKDGDVLTIVDGDPAWPSMNGGDWGEADSVPAETYTVNVVVESATPGWHKDANGWYYINADGTLATNKWVKDSKGWCYLDDNGRMIYNNFAKDSKGQCYVGSNGYMDTSTKWVKVDGEWYHITSGYMDTNKWVKDSKGWCYLGADGKMVKNTWKKESKGWCYVGADGYMV
ncbi:MAG: DUF4430 domain-containing protein, partial [Coriobacteriales bacterium]|nr:DUF4430 domain-containing protein [Coriobacteriales bacterium]